MSFRFHQKMFCDNKSTAVKDSGVSMKPWIYVYEFDFRGISDEEVLFLNNFLSGPQLQLKKNKAALTPALENSYIFVTTGVNFEQIDDELI
jgi:hypothetical protein